MYSSMWWIFDHSVSLYSDVSPATERTPGRELKLKRNMFKETGSKVEHVFWRPIQLIWNFLYLSWWFGRLVEEKKKIRLLLLKHLLFPKFVPRAVTEFHSGLSSFLYHWSIFSIDRLPLDPRKICLSIDVHVMGGFRNSFPDHSRVYEESFTFESSLKMGLRSSIADPDPGSGAVKIRFRDEHPGSYFRELRNNFWVHNT